MNKEEIINIAKEGAKLLVQYAENSKTKILFEYSPESFTGTEMDFALEICGEVLDILKPSADNKVIINLPATVEISMPHIYASQIEYMSEHIKYRENVLISLHPHNDRGCAVAATEMGLLAGADRVEGTLFGNGERTGNADIITTALNMYVQGIDPKLDFSNLPLVADTYERLTGMPVNDRQPYAGRLVYAAFSGSHQDAIAKGMKYRKNNEIESWSVPYLPIDPKDVGREYDKDVIRINSQSGKGGIGYLLERNYGYNLPANMREDLGYKVKDISDKSKKELTHKDIFNIFIESYMKPFDKFTLVSYDTSRKGKDTVYAETVLNIGGGEVCVNSQGNGRLDAVSNGIKEALDVKYTLLEYQEHALTKGSDSKAVAYVGIVNSKGEKFFGVETDTDIITASVKALINAVNRLILQ